MSLGALRQCLPVCLRRPCLPSSSVGEEAQPCASGYITIQMMVYGCSRSHISLSKIRTPHRRAMGTEKPLCRQGDTQGVAPTLLSCPIGFAVCCLRRFAVSLSTPPATDDPHRHGQIDDAHFSRRTNVASNPRVTPRFLQTKSLLARARTTTRVRHFSYFSSLRQVTEPSCKLGLSSQMFACCGIKNCSVMILSLSNRLAAAEVQIEGAARHKPTHN